MKHNHAPALVSLLKLGQSIWIDNLSRTALETGELAELVNRGVRGLTSNPAIFKQSIADSNAYDTEIRDQAAKGIGTETICENLMVDDVARAADLLRPIYDSSEGVDGYVSLEVSPALAHNTQGTIESARRLWSALSRKNIMIKVPATKEGIPAVKQLLSEGINVNITLIFSEVCYREVAEAYITALEQRVSLGQPISMIASVASFFVSRVDTIVDKSLDSLVAAGQLDSNKREDLAGMSGIANSKVAYAAYREIFGSPRFQRLASHGARVQRPLWASTSTKNPKFHALLYVRSLAGRDTVNTVPPVTLTELLKAETVSAELEEGLENSRAMLDRIRSAGVPFEKLLEELQVQGVKVFADAYTVLLQSIETKKA